ncbi:hypothetical protein [Polymorphum gilvum]|nr:hypothetical protein [Polymorphum gilvum]
MAKPTREAPATASPQKAGDTSSQPTPRTGTPSAAQRRWLERGLRQPGGKLPLFDEGGREIPARTIRACIAAGWAEPWFSNPIKPDWLVCRLTGKGVEALGSVDLGAGSTDDADARSDAPGAGDGDGPGAMRAR